MEAARKALKEKGLEVSRPTLYDWEGKYDWKNRKSEIDLRRQETEGQTQDENLLAGLLSQKKKFEGHFDSLGIEIDPQVTYAYTNIVKSIIDIRAKTNANRVELFMEFFKNLIDYAHKNDPQAVDVIERNLDDFVQYIREKYGN